MNPSKQPPGAVQVSDAWPVAKAATLRVTRQDARSASDGTSAGGEADVRIMHRRLMAAVPADSAVLRSEKSDVVANKRGERRPYGALFPGGGGRESSQTPGTQVW